MSSLPVVPGPLPPSTHTVPVRGSGHRYDIAQKVQSLTLYWVGIDVAEIEAITGVTPSGFYRILRVAKQRGYDPARSPRILLEYVAVGKSTGRPRKDKASIENTGLTTPPGAQSELT